MNQPMSSRSSARILALLELAEEAPTLDELAEFLSDDDPQVRGTALTVLSESAEHWDAASPAFAAALSDPDRSVRGIAISLLRELREVLVPGEAFTAALRTAGQHADAVVRAAAVGALWRHRRCTTEDLTKALLDDAEPVRVEAVLGLVSLDALDALDEAADDRSTEVRMAVARGLAAIGDPRGAATLIVLAGDDEVLVRAAALEAMAQTGCTGRALASARAGLTEPAWQVRQGAATALSAADPAVAAGPLIEATRDGNLDVRKAAVRALGPWRPGRPEINAALRAALSDPDADVRAFARMGMENHGREN
jgi:HEAT repeat protein